MLQRESFAPKNLKIGPKQAYIHRDMFLSTIAKDPILSVDPISEDLVGRGVAHNGPASDLPLTLLQTKLIALEKGSVVATVKGVQHPDKTRLGRFTQRSRSSSSKERPI